MNLIEPQRRRYENKPLRYAANNPPRHLAIQPLPSAPLSRSLARLGTAGPKRPATGLSGNRRPLVHAPCVSAACRVGEVEGATILSEPAYRRQAGLTGSASTPHDMSKGEVLIYQGKDGFTQVSVRLEEETVWLNQNQLAELFQTTKQNVGQHIKNILGDGELEAEGTVKDFFTVAREGRRNVKRLVEHYNLDMIISVGYRP